MQRNVENLTPSKWEVQSQTHHHQLLKLCKKSQSDVQEICGVRFCCSSYYQIGAGSHGTRVFVGLGKDGTERAVKRILKNDFSDLARHEKEILLQRNTVDSAYTVKYWFLDTKSSPDFDYLFLNLCEETLADFVQSKGMMELKQEAPNIISDILHGLSDLHQRPRPIIHRDLNPYNILRTIYGRWLLADFGDSVTLREEQSTWMGRSAGRDFWRAAETYPADGTPQDSEVRYMKQSDIQVAGMVVYYVVTKGEHAFGKRDNFLSNLRHGKPVGLDTLELFELKDLLCWMLSHQPEDRPYADQALKHPYFLSPEDQFELLARMGNEPEIKQKISSNAVNELNRDRTDWRKKMSEEWYGYLRLGGRKNYGSEWTECLRFIRNCQQQWEEKLLPRQKELPDDPHEFFLKLFPNLPVKVHKIVRNSDWKNRRGLLKFFYSGCKRMEEHDKQQPAVGQLKNELDIAKDEDDKSKVYELSFTLGLNHYQKYEFQEALMYFSQCLDVASELENKELECKAHQEIGQVYRSKGDCPEALKYFHRFLEIASNQENKPLQGQAHLLLGLAHRLMGNYSYAQEENEKGLKISLDIADCHLQAHAELAMGIVSRLMVKLPEALDHYEKCKNISSRIGNKDNECVADLGFGVIYKWQEKYSEAMTHFKESLSIAEEIDKRYIVYCANLELGYVYKLKGECLKAKKYFQKSLEIHEFRGFRQEHWELGLLCDEQKECKEALEHFKKHLEFLKATDKSTKEAFEETYQKLLDIAEQLGRHDMIYHLEEERKKFIEDYRENEMKARGSHFEGSMFEVEALAMGSKYTKPKQWVRSER